jgi:hypothetical protein
VLRVLQLAQLEGMVRSLGGGRLVVVVGCSMVVAVGRRFLSWVLCMGGRAMDFVFGKKMRG